MEASALVNKTDACAWGAEKPGGGPVLLQELVLSVGVPDTFPALWEKDIPCPEYKWDLCLKAPCTP